MHAFDVLGDPVRRRILELLTNRDQRSGEVAELIQREFAISQAAVSQHLKVLRDSGFATSRKDGVRRVYSVRPQAFKEIDRWLERFRHLWEPRLDALAIEIARGKRRRRRSTP